ncbi:site-specific integrase [Vibrio splendidus]|uniref:site-specific integrase n=1 Tax=Vibrio splendidus TaxID=29497 RepID=UPI001056203D|nr:site-specific integrase [Vibrio splendidus]
MHLMTWRVFIMADLKVEKLKEFNRTSRIPTYGLSKDGKPLGYIYDLVWVFTGHVDVGLGKATEISFKNIDETMRREIQEAVYKKILISGTVSISYLKTIKYNYYSIKLAIGGKSFNALDNDEVYREYRKILKSQRRSPAGVERIACSLNDLYLTGYINRNHGIGGQKKFIQDISDPDTGNGQNIAIPERLMFEVYGEALNYVEKYYPIRHKINLANKKYYELLQEFKKTGKSTQEFHKYVKKYGKDIDLELVNDNEFVNRVIERNAQKQSRKKLISSIQTACIIVLGGFSGVRIGEIFSFYKSNYKTIKINNISTPLLVGYNTKNQRGGRRKKEIYPTHEVSKKALTLAYDITQNMRKIYLDKIPQSNRTDADKEKLIEEAKSTFISIAGNSSSTTLLVGHIGRLIQSFAFVYGSPATIDVVKEFNMLNPTRVGQLELGGFLPHLTPHSLRRTFAVFLKRNSLANLLTIRYGTKHKNLAMTALYTNQADLSALRDFEMDSELAGMIKEANDDLFADELFYIFNEAETLSGGEGKRILKEREFYQGTIYKSRENILNNIKNKMITLVELPTGYCIKKDCAQTCFNHDCQTKIVTYEKAMYQAKARDRIIVRFNKYNVGKPYSQAILEKMLIEIKSIELTLDEHKIEHTPFDGKILSPDLV